VSESSKDAWFYSAKGERLGPVSMEQLRELAASGQLHPRLDMCWSQGMEQWIPAGEVEGLFETKRIEKPAETMAADASSVRQAKPVNKLSESELESALQNADWPGSSRRVYLFVIWVLPFIMGGAVAGLSYLLLDPEDSDSAGILSLVSSAVSLVLLGAFVFVSLQRLQNLGMSRWWFIGNFIPLLNLWVGYRSICCPAGYEFHRKLDGIGKVLAVLYWGMFILAIGFMVFIVLAFLGIVGAGIFGDFEIMLQNFEESQHSDGE